MIQNEDQLLEQQILAMKIPLQQENNPRISNNTSLWEEKTTIKQSTKHNKYNPHKFHHYADKQLLTLVMVEEFDFAKIASLLNIIFQNDRIEFTQTMCRQRWLELHINRNKMQYIKQQNKKDKKAKAISGMINPYQYYNINQLIQHMQEIQKTQKIKKSQIFHEQYQGYNIFKNSYKQIDKIEQYNQQKQSMLLAMNQAQQPQAYIDNKPMLFSPEYQKFNDFSVKEQQLTLQSMQKMVSSQISHNDTTNREKDDLIEKNYKSSFKKKIQVYDMSINQTQKYEIEENWDQYQSD